MLKAVLHPCMIGGMILLGACHVMQGADPTQFISKGEEIPYTELVLDELDPDILANPRRLGCSLSDLPPFGWKEVDSGMVDIRTPEDYTIRIGSLYQEGYRAYLENRVDFPDTCRSTEEMSYEEFLATCNVFPAVDFSRHSVLGYHATGTGCKVTFEKHVYRDDPNKAILYELTVIEEGACEMAVHDRNLILVPRIPADTGVTFSLSGRNE
jgi:hypothetical protein